LNELRHDLIVSPIVILVVINKNNMRRGTLEKSKGKPKEAIGFTLENKAVVRRNVVDEVLTMFKAGNRDVNAAAKIINEGENGNQPNMIASLE
jgi:hypothetical protein